MSGSRFLCNYAFEIGPWLFEQGVLSTTLLALALGDRNFCVKFVETKTKLLLH